MIVGCPQCDTRFRVDDDRIHPGGIKVRCSRCAHVFRAYPEGSDSSAVEIQTRRVDAAAMIALALETAPPKEAEGADNASTQELALDVAEGFEGFEGSIERPSFEDLFTDDQARDPFENIDGDDDEGPQDAFAGAMGITPLPGPPSIELGPSDLLDERANAAFADPSIDLPGLEAEPEGLGEELSAPGFLASDSDSEESSDLALMEADFLGRSSSSQEDELIEDKGWNAAAIGRVQLTGLGADLDEQTRFAGDAPRGPVAGPRPSSLGRTRWPTALGFLAGLAITSTFIPGWAPAPLDAIAPAVANFLHPASQPRLPNAYREVRSENARAFPYSLPDRTLVVVRGEAVNTGREPQSDVWVTVLMLDEQREIARVSAALNDLPTPTELVDRLKATPSPPESGGRLEPGARAPFLVVFPDPPPEAQRYRFRVEFSPKPRPSAKKAQSPIR